MRLQMRPRSLQTQAEHMIGLAYCLVRGGGGYEIRTREGLPPTRFPSVRPRPLGESSKRRGYRRGRGNPKSGRGPRSRSPRVGRMDELVPRPVGPADVDALQELIESDPGYTERITGYPPGPADAQSLLMMRPEDLAEESKIVLGAFAADQLVAVVDLLRGFPNDHTAFIGLLEVHAKHQGLGHGSKTYSLVERYVATTWPEIRTLRLAVVDSNAQVATGF